MTTTAQTGDATVISTNNGVLNIGTSNKRQSSMITFEIDVNAQNSTIQASNAVFSSNIQVRTCEPKILLSASNIIRSPVVNLQHQILSIMEL